MSDTEAIFVADIHMSHQPPVARSGEKSWYESMAGYLEQLWDLGTNAVRKGNMITRNRCIPIVAAGDIFDKWNASAELINFAIEHLPVMYSVAGNHDTPPGGLADIKKSAYWTLVQAGKIIDLKPNEPVTVGNLCLHGFPFGADRKRYAFPKNSMVLDIAVVHEYVWTGSYGHHRATEEQSLKQFRKRMGSGFDWIVTGDNHQSFIATKQEPKVCNAGGFMRRTVAEIDHKPRAWLLKRDGSMVPHLLDVSKDVILSKEELGRRVKDDPRFADDLLRELKHDEQTAIDFEEVMKQCLSDGKSVNRRVKDCLLEIMEEARK